MDRYWDSSWGSRSNSEISCKKKRVHERLQEMLSEWLKKIDPSPTWKELIDTLKIIDPAKAKEIADSLARA